MWFVLSFRIHVYNNEDLMLCALPYHDEPEFVRIVQILDTRLVRYYYVFLVWLRCRLLLVGEASDVFVNFCKGILSGGILMV